MDTTTRSTINRELAKVLAYAACGKMDSAAVHAAKLIEQLRGIGVAV